MTVVVAPGSAGYVLPSTVVTVSSPVSAQAPVWNGSAWVPGAFDAAGAAAAAAAASVPLSANGALPDSLLTFQLANSGAVGSASGSGGGTQNLDHTVLLQAYINTVSAATAAFNQFAVAVIDCPPLHYRVQNLTLPGNVKLRCNGTFFQYVSSAGTAPSSQGPGNYVIRCYGAYNTIEGAVIEGGGTADTMVGGIWLMPTGAAGSGSARAYQNVIRDCVFDNLAGRAIYDQGVGNHIEGRNFAENVLLGATSIGHFMGALELAGTDAYVSDGEFGASVNSGNGNVLGTIGVPRCPVAYDVSASTTTNGSISLPLSNGTITLTSTAFASTTGGVLLIGGTMIAYTAISGATLTGCYSGGTGTITTATNVYVPTGFAAALVVSGANNWVRDTDAEISDVSVYLGPSLLASVTAGVTLTVVGTGTNPVAIDSSAHLPVAGGTLSVWSGGSANITFTTFTYGSISNTTVLTALALTQSGQSLNVGSTTGWPASGTLNWNGRVITYTSIVDGTHIGGCTISSGTVTIPVGAYITANTLNACYVASSTLVLTVGEALLSTTLPTQTKMTQVRGDLSMTHSWILGPGAGQLLAPEALRCGVSANNTYDGFHCPGLSASNWDAFIPTSDSTGVTNRHRYAFLDQNNSGAAQNRFTGLRDYASVSGASVGNTQSGWVTLPDSGGTVLTLNSATPTVAGQPAFVDVNSTATTITNFLTGVNGQEITVLQGVNTTIANNANIVTKTGANLSPPGSGWVALRFKKIGYSTTPTPAWYQL